MNGKNGKLPNRSVVILPLLLQLYIIQGIPVGLAFDAYPTLLRNSGVSLGLISLIPLAALPWVLKFLWAPFVENHWSARIGRRKSWLIPMQFLLALFILLIAFIPFKAETTPFLFIIITLSCFVGSTQDISADGLATHASSHTSLRKINAIQVGGAIIGMLIGGSGVIFCVSYIGKMPTIFILSALIFTSTYLVYRWQEPLYGTNQRTQAKISLFFKQRCAIRMLILVLLVPFTGSVVHGIAKLMLIDNHFSLREVGFINGVGSYLLMLIGCTAATWLLKYQSFTRVLFSGLFLLALLCVLWIIFNNTPSLMTFPAILTVMSLIGITMGIVNVNIHSLVMNYVAKSQQATTDYALFQSSLLFSEIIAASFSVAIAEYFGYNAALGLGIVVALMTLAFIRRIGRGS